MLGQKKRKSLPIKRVQYTKTIIFIRSKMELHWVWMIVATLLGCFVFIFKIVRRLNEWYYYLKLGKKQYHQLPPGDLGWPLIGNMLSFIKVFFFDRQPDAFFKNFISRNGKGGLYKTHLFLYPAIVVHTPELSRRVLSDDNNFRRLYPFPLNELVSAILGEISSEEHRRFKNLVTLPILGYKALEMYAERIEETIINSLEEMASKNRPIQFLKELKFLSMKVIVDIFIGSYNQKITNKIAHMFGDVDEAAYSLPIYLPGFSYHQGKKSRRKLDKIVQTIVDERKMMTKNGEILEKKDLLDFLLEIEDAENGRKLKDQEIIDLLVMFLFAGHESTANITTVALTFLVRHSLVWKKAKEEQEEIIKARPPSQKHTSRAELKQMNYLNMVIDETLRLTMNFAAFRQATADVNINGCIVPKGWLVLAWARAFHMNPQQYPNPEEFNPSRWSDYNASARNFLPFGFGTMLCPGRDLAKLQIKIFLHHFLLNYKLERVNPKCPLICFPMANIPNDYCLAKVIKVSSK